MGSELLEYFNNNELAANVWLNKYAQEGEKTPEDMHKRMAKEFARIEQNYVLVELDKSNLSNYGEKRKDLRYSDIFNLFKDFKYIIPQGSVMSQLGAKNIGSLSNCFVIGQPHDSYGGIFQKDQEQVQLMKRRGGVGIDISTLRPAGTTTTNAAKSSTGAISFMHRFSNSTREVAQNGRRGALMISIDINHPDVMDFIKIKRDLTQVTGANISIKLNDDFMKAVENDEDYILRFPCNIPVDNSLLASLTYNELTTYSHVTLQKDQSGYIKKVKAKEYWDETIKSAHNVAEPGLMFWDNMVDYSPDGVYPQFKQITTNPCSEIAMQPYDACRLMVVNLYSFVENPFTEKAVFNMNKFYQVNYEAMRLSDNLVDLEMEHIERILSKIDSDPEPTEIKVAEKELWKKVYTTAKASRRTGLGITALGDTLAALGLPYISDEGLETIETIMKVKMESELDCTTDMAITRGTFEGWNPVNEIGPFYKFLDEAFPEQANRMDVVGRRNVSWSTIAPTGSVSILTQTTGGVEPLFMGYYIRRKKVNPNDENVRVDFTDQNGDTWQEFPVLHPKFKDWIKGISTRDNIDWKTTYTEEDLKRLFEKSPWYGSTANDIDWVKRVELQAICQKYITHSISSTINLPEDVSEESVSEIYLESWKKGLKGITVYREGSRSGVMVSDTKKEESFEYLDAYKRPKELNAETHYTTTKGVSYHVIVGKVGDKPYEVFIDDSENKYSPYGKLIKKSKNKYIFLNGGEPIEVRTFMTPEQQAITRLTSANLRHGVDVKFIVEQLQKIDGDMFDFTKSLARVLKKYIPDGSKSTASCNDCGSNNVIFQEGCNTCQDCGSSACS